MILLFHLVLIAINKLPRNNVIHRNAANRLSGDIRICSCFPQQIDESTDINDTVQLMVFVRIIFEVFKYKEDMLCMTSLEGRTKDMDMFEVFKTFETVTILFKVNFHNCQIL